MKDQLCFVEGFGFYFEDYQEFMNYFKKRSNLISFLVKLNFFSSFTDSKLQGNKIVGQKINENLIQ